MYAYAIHARSNSQTHTHDAHANTGTNMCLTLVCIGYVSELLVCFVCVKEGACVVYRWRRACECTHSFCYRGHSTKIATEMTMSWIGHVANIDGPCLALTNNTRRTFKCRCWLGTHLQQQWHSEKVAKWWWCFSSNTLQNTVTHCNTLQRTVPHCSTLQHTATHCNALQHTVTHCSTHEWQIVMTYTYTYVYLYTIDFMSSQNATSQKGTKAVSDTQQTLSNVKKSKAAAGSAGVFEWRTT